MATFRVDSIEERTDGDVACDTRVFNDGAQEIAHFTLIIDATDVLMVAGLPKAERIAAHKTLFADDPRITGITDSEAAVSQIEADVTFPVEVTL
jgi:hypothetical protein